MEKTELRKVIRLSDNAVIRMQDLKKGDVFEVYETDGACERVGTYVAISNGYDANGVGTVDVITDDEHPTSGEL